MPAASFQRHEQLGEIVVDNPPMNLFSNELIADLRHAVDQAAGTDVRAVVLRANGPRSPPAPTFRSSPGSMTAPRQR
jgi:enoyl-CoA hydratase/carnithine racemase